MKDFDSDEMIKIDFVRQKFLETAKIFGFDLMEPSPIELLDTLEKKSGSAIKNEIYQFKDKGDREVALRFDFTVGLTRYVASQKTLKLPAKFSSFGGVWRYDEPQKGRYRFFHQWNIETFGNIDSEHDAENIEFTSRLFDNIGLQNIVIDINHRRVVQSYIGLCAGLHPDAPALHDVFRAIDKIQKKSKDEILEEYEPILGKDAGNVVPREKLEQVLDAANLKGKPEEVKQEFDRKMAGLGNIESVLDGWDELCATYDSLKARGIDNIRINFGIVRGLDYYTGIVFEAFDTTSDLGALVGGGRYDSLPKVFGRDDLGATGVAGGVERIILRLDEQGISCTPSSTTTSVLYVNDELKPHAIDCASKLRKLGVIVNIDLTTKSLKKQMENSSGSKFSIIFAPKEFAEKNVVLRNMVDRTEKQISLDELVTNPKDILNL
jgi:histidyl-tRNA synthetase